MPDNSYTTPDNGANMEKFTATVTILDDYGLHARPAANLARLAQNFQAEISLTAGANSADAKSILDILALAASKNTELTIECNGPDAPLAGEALLKLFRDRFNLPGPDVPGPNVPGQDVSRQDVSRQDGA